MAECQGSTSCIWDEIDRISYGRVDGQTIRKLFRRYGSVKFYPSDFASHYVFCGVVRSKGADDRTYANTFAKFILDHGLGVISKSPAVKNNRNHPESLGRVYIWTPDGKALADFLNKGEPKKPAVRG